MEYPKELMSISELIKLGYTRDMLMNYSRARGAPVVWTMGGGKVYFKTSELDAFIVEMNERIAKQKAANKKKRVRRYRKSA